MSDDAGHSGSERLEQIIGNLLRAGVLVSAAIVLLGAAVYLARHSGDIPSYAAFHGEPEELRSAPGIVAGAIRFRGRSLIQLGLLVLILTPVARVALAAAGFALQRDKIYVAVALIVLGLLVYGLAAG